MLHMAYGQGEENRSFQSFVFIIKKKKAKKNIFSHSYSYADFVES